ncbi:death domain-containing membrane protein NRADD-like isoform X2 [Symphalangus syndactylus]|uniref:death domain-containing membrane protein NRADD-like isoform X2 n=1 Tax=Symphalangus syndactylus TaxID=9590 RepID=UPI002442F909|nr:death domain-containing membrane protein NRADD-like isoform X2 [Symphalangus syndactylus]
MLHNSSHSKGLAYVGKILRRQERDREGVWVGAGEALATNTSSPFLLEPPGVSGSIIPVYCTLLATVVLGLLAYVAFKCWHSHKQRQQLAKARTAEVGGLNKDQMHGIAVSSWTLLAVWSPVPPARHQEKVERLLEVSREPDKGWQGLADHLGYRAEAVEIMAQGQV